MGVGAGEPRQRYGEARVDQGGDHVIAHTLPGPNPSAGVLVSLGFEHVAEQQDPEAGTVWEWIWTRPMAT